MRRTPTSVLSPAADNPPLSALKGGFNAPRLCSVYRRIKTDYNKPMLKIYNTLGRELQEFQPIKKDRVLLYQCGPTVYWTQHIGNMRAAVETDLIVRSLHYLGYDVTFVRNYTDVGHLTGDNLGDADSGEDRMEKGAKRENTTPDEIAKKYIEIFEADVRGLNIVQPDKKPRATQYVKEMIKMVSELLKKGFAYETSKAVYFDVSKFPHYNDLNRQKLEENREGAGSGHVSDPEKKHQQDFAIWFFKTGVHKRALQTWKSPFHSPDVENGEGFPGWHIECSAMIRKLLGKTIDVHMGGIEHVSVHHTNEIAQSEAANGTKLADFWLHYEHLTVDGKKMAKSEGTAFSMAEIKEKGFDPLDLRTMFLQAHYRSKQDFTWKNLEAARKTRENIVEKIIHMKQELGRHKVTEKNINDEFQTKFIEALDNDFNVPEAFALVQEVLKSDLHMKEKLATIFSFDEVLGLELHRTSLPKNNVTLTAEVEMLLSERAKARAAKNWAESDRIRDELKSKHGLIVSDKPTGQHLEKA